MPLALLAVAEHLDCSRMAAERLARSRKLWDCGTGRGHRSQAGWSTASPGMGHQALEAWPLRESLCSCSSKAQHHVYLEMTSSILLHSLSCLLSCSRRGTLSSIQDQHVSGLQPYAPAGTYAQQYQLQQVISLILPSAIRQGTAAACAYDFQCFMLLMTGATVI